MSNRTRLIIGIALVAVSLLMRSGMIPVPDGGGIVPGPDVPDDVTVGLVIVEDALTRPDGLETVIRSQWWEDLESRMIDAERIDPSDTGEKARKYINALGDDIPGYVLVRYDTRRVLDYGPLEIPVTTDGLDALIKREVGR